jgi:hypothetical protein
MWAAVADDPEDPGCPGRPAPRFSNTFSAWSLTSVAVSVARASAPVDHGRSPWLIMLLSKEEDQHKGCGG